MNALASVLCGALVEHDYRKPAANNDVLQPREGARSHVSLPLRHLSAALECHIGDTTLVNGARLRKFNLLLIPKYANQLLLLTTMFPFDLMFR